MGKLLDLQRGVTAEPPYRVVEELRGGAWQCLAPGPQPPDTAPVAPAQTCCSGHRGLRGSSESLTASVPEWVLGCRESRPGRERGRPPPPGLPGSDGLLEITQLYL